MQRVFDAKIPVGLGPALTELGVSAPDVLASAGLPSRLLNGDTSRVALDRYLAVWQAIRAVSGTPGIGLLLVQAIRAEHTEPLFLAVLGARNLAGALDAVVRYKRILGPEKLHVGGYGAHVTAGYEWPAVDGAVPEVPDVLVDAELAFVVEMARRATRDPDLAPARVRLRRRRIEPDAGLEDYFRCPIETAVERDGLVFTADATTRPFLTHNPSLLGALAAHLAEGACASPVPGVEGVREAITQQLRGRRPTLRSVSAELAMSPRSLQRFLHERGTSFRAVLDEVRNDHARYYLRTTRFGDPEIAYLLGYDEPSSFARAFRSWNGLSPAQFRRMVTA